MSASTTHPEVLETAAGEFPLHEYRLHYKDDGCDVDFTWRRARPPYSPPLPASQSQWGRNHYDQIGLLTPSHRTESGHRLYDRDDVVRLQQIVMLRQLGFALDEIGAALRRADTSLPRLIEMHLARLRGQIERERRLCARLEQMSARLRAEEEVTVDEFMKTIEEMTMFEKYMTEEQLETLRTQVDTFVSRVMAS